MNRRLLNLNNTDLDTILSQLFSLQRFGIKPGLERTLELLAKCNHPHLHFPSIHIAGTNGKGAVSSMLASIFMEAGYKTAIYTSPHIISFNERIRINGRKISNDELSYLASKHLNNAKENNATFFEITTAMAFDYFNYHNVDIAIIETGLGGKYDSTNVITPLLSIITSLSLEHTEYLGSNLIAIASEKAGIIKPSVPVVLHQFNDDIMNVFNQKAATVNAPIYHVGNNIDVISHLHKTKLTSYVEIKTDIGLYKIEFPLPGLHQIANLKLVIKTCELLTEQFNLRPKDIETGIQAVINNTDYRARIEIINTSPISILDVAHNPSSILALVNTIRSSPLGTLKFNILFAAMRDKDIKSMIEILKPISSKFILTTPKIDRAAQYKDLEELNLLSELDYVYYNDVIDAYLYCNQLNEPFIVVGSFYLVGEVLEYLQKIK